MFDVHTGRRDDGGVAEPGDAQLEIFAAFYRRNAPRVAQYFAQRVDPADAVVDLTAETFVSAFEHRGEFRGTTRAEAEGWLFAIARSQLARHMRERRRDRTAVDGLRCAPEEVQPEACQVLISRYETERVQRKLVGALARLPAEQAYCVQQRTLMDRRYCDLASELGVSEDVVRARVSRGLHALLRSWDEC